ncbi:carboxypeptidase-like regulatory domain-containing protein [Hymenobacter sp. AT01-02]|uniref:carboxypeptidase-like regulatory domain-containing protein n=1 Tax=Hymenobacter sp. AT01-02 TaxID=1571877 RepID=UPI00069614BA|nr:carboxypeptidase-like regulatory domain-containing protein [Hymenobacter sp. AT01-02]
MNQYLYTQTLLRRALWLAACGGPVLAAPLAANASTTPDEGVTRRAAVADVTISGRVTQENGDPLPGVTIIVKGTTLGTSSNSDGGFTLTAPEGSTLIFSYVALPAKKCPLRVLLPT